MREFIISTSVGVVGIILMLLLAGLSSGSEYQAGRFVRVRSGGEITEMIRYASDRAESIPQGNRWRLSGKICNVSDGFFASTPPLFIRVAELFASRRFQELRELVSREKGEISRFRKYEHVVRLYAVDPKTTISQISFIGNEFWGDRKFYTAREFLRDCK